MQSETRHIISRCLQLRDDESVKDVNLSIQKLSNRLELTSRMIAYFVDEQA